MKKMVMLNMGITLLLLLAILVVGCQEQPPQKPPPPSPSTEESATTSSPQTTEPADEINVVNLPSSPFPVSFDEVRRTMDALEGYVMTATISDARDEYTLTLVISNDCLETYLAGTEDSLLSQLRSQFKLVLLGHAANVRPKSTTALKSALIKSGDLDLNNDDLWVRIDLSETWPVFGGGGSWLSWHVPLLFIQARAEIHRPLLFDPRIPSDFFDVSIRGGESWDGLELTRILVRTDWMAVFQWLIDSNNLTRAWEGPHDEWSSEVELWVDGQNLVRQMKVEQSDRFAVYWEVWVHEPFGASSYGYVPQFPAQDVVVDFTYDEVPEVVPPAYDAVVLTKDMLQ